MTSPDISFQDALLCTIMPLMEEEINKRVAIKLEHHLAESKVEYATLRKQYNDLTRKYAALESEMSRSRQIFEEKRKEWHDIKVLMTQSLQAKGSQVTKSVESEELTQMITQPQVNSGDNKDLDSQPTLGTDPLNFLAADLQFVSSQELSSQKSAASVEVIEEVNVQQATVNVPQRYPSPSKVARYVEPMKNKAERKNAHAKDCPCCTKVLILRF